jgi:hypothetical protein
MANGYSRSPKLLKGALVEFSERFIGPIPNIIVFQYNPESLTRSMEVYNPFQEADITEERTGKKIGTAHWVSASAQPFDPPETFSLTLELDATDDLETGDPIAVKTGVEDRVAALEMLLYPQEESLLGGLVSSVSTALGGGAISDTALPRGTVPIVLFVWGAGRVVPVRLTTFQVEEQAFSPLLYPIRAKISIGIRVLSKFEISLFPDSRPKDIAIAAYKVTLKQKQALAAANVANSVKSILGSVESILGMLPF